NGSDECCNHQRANCASNSADPRGAQVRMNKMRFRFLSPIVVAALVAGGCQPTPPAAAKRPPATRAPKPAPAPPASPARVPAAPSAIDRPAEFRRNEPAPRGTLESLVA